MPYIIFLIFLAFATAVAVSSQQLNFNLYFPVIGLSILVGQIAIFCFTSGTVLLKSGDKRSGVRTLHYGISLSLIVLTSIYYLYNSVIDSIQYTTTAMYIMGAWFSITSFDAILKFVNVGVLNISSDSQSVVKATRLVSAATLIICLLCSYVFLKYLLNIDLKINL